MNGSSSKQLRVGGEVGGEWVQ